MAGKNGSKPARKKSRTAIRLDMTPMVDIAFLLLIFYMATTQFKPPEARAVVLPESHSRVELPSKDVITITVTRSDSIFVDFVDAAEPDADVDQPGPVLRHTVASDLSRLAKDLIAARKRNPYAYIAIKADKDARFGLVQDITDVMRENGCPRLLIVTDHDEAS